MTISVVSAIMAAAGQHKMRTGHAAEYVVVGESVRDAINAEMQEMMLMVQTGKPKEPLAVTRLASMRVMVMKGEEMADRFSVGTFFTWP